MKAAESEKIGISELKIGITAGKNQADGPSNKALRKMLSSFGKEQFGVSHLVEIDVSGSLEENLRESTRKELQKKIKPKISDLIKQKDFGSLREQYKKKLQEVDGLILPGNQHHVAQEISGVEDGLDFCKDEKLDQTINELVCIDIAKDNSIPIFGICKGFQLLAVHGGGQIENRDFEKERLDADKSFLSIKYEDSKKQGGNWGENTLALLNNTKYEEGNIRDLGGKHFAYNNVMHLAHTMQVKDGGYNMKLIGDAVQLNDKDSIDAEYESYPVAGIGEMGFISGTQFHPEWDYVDDDKTEKIAKRQALGEHIVGNYLNKVKAVKQVKDNKGTVLTNMLEKVNKNFKLL